MSISNNLCGKIISSLEPPVIFDKRFFILDFNLVNPELEKFTFELLYLVIVYRYHIKTKLYRYHIKEIIIILKFIVKNTFFFVPSKMKCLHTWVSSKINLLHCFDYFSHTGLFVY